MLSTCKVLLIISFSATIACSSAPTLNTEKEELIKLDNGLNAIAAGQESNWLERLDAVKKIKLKSSRVKNIQNICVKAYDAYADALLSLNAAKKNINTLSIAVNKGQKDNLKQQNLNAQNSIKKTNEALDRSQKLIKECSLKKLALKKQLKL